MSPKTITEKDQVYLKLFGSIYMVDAIKIRESLIDYIEKGHNDFIIDLREVDYIDSSCLGVIITIRNRALQNSSCVIIQGLQGLVKDLFVLTQMGKAFDIQ